MHKPHARSGLERVWGDGLSGQPLSSFYAHTTWDDVSSDELIVLLPALTRQGKNKTSRDAAFFTRQALTTRVFDCVSRMSGEVSASNSVPVSRQAAVALITQSQTVTAVSVIDSSVGGEDIWRETFGRRAAPRRRNEGSPTPEATSAQADDWAFELSILACLDQLLRDAERSQEKQGSKGIRPSDALLGSIYATFNAAYVYPELDYMQDTLMLGAWLGVLERGRSALMPSFIAEIVLAHLNREPDKNLGHVADEARCEALIRTHLEFAGPSKSLMRLAERVRSSGRASLVAPASQARSSALHQAVMSEALKQRLIANGVIESKTSPTKPSS